MLRLNVKNFQSLEDVFIDVNGLTILRGESGVGKSAVIRCMKALLQNRWGRGMIRKGASFCDTAIDFCDGNKLLARKTSENMIYRMFYADGNTRDYTAMRREIPEEMGKVFGLTVFDDGTSKTLMQIRGQYDRPLLIEVTHKRLSGMLGDGSEWIRCVGVDKLMHSWLGVQKGRERGLIEMEETSEKRISEMETKLSKLSEKKDVISTKFKEIEELNEKMALLKSLSDSVGNCTKNGNSVLLLKKIVDSLSAIGRLNERLTNLRSLSVATTPVSGVSELKYVLEKVSGLDSLNQRMLRLIELKNTLQTLDSGKFTIEDLHSRLSGDVCPVCGAKLV